MVAIFFCSVIMEEAEHRYVGSVSPISGNVPGQSFSVHRNCSKCTKISPLQLRNELSFFRIFSCITGFFVKENKCIAEGQLT